MIAPLDSQTVAFAIAAAVLTLTPGQDTLLVVRNVLRGGRGDGIVTAFGICAGLFVHAALSALGVSILLMRSATVFQVVKLAGAIYLTGLGIRSLVSAVRDAQDRVDVEEQRSPEAALPASSASPASRRRCLLEGFLSNVLNPKTAVFYLAFLPQFIGAGDFVLQKSVLLAGVHYAESVLWLGTVAVAVDRTRRLFLRAIVRRWLDGICGALLVGFGVRLALARR